MFVLPNNIHVDEDGIADAMEDRNPRTVGVFDIMMGHVAVMQKAEFRAAALDPKRYFPIPKISQKEEAKWMRKFVSTLLTVEHPLLAKRILAAFKKEGDKGLDIAILLITKDKEGWIDGWNWWKGDSFWSEMIAWFETLPVAVEHTWGDDDCELCKLAKEGPHTIREYKEAAALQRMKEAGSEDFVLPPDEKNKERVQDDYYYDAMDAANEGDFERAGRLLHEALKLDEHNVQTHVGLANVYGMAKEKEKGRQHIVKAYEETAKQFPKWPKQMEWGFLENRRFLRAIQWRAEMYIDEGEREKGVELYRQLLRMNPGDNQGVRYVLAGLYAGINGDEVNQMFDEGNEKQNWDKLEKMVKEQNKKRKFWKEPEY